MDVCVVIPTKDEGETIGELLESIKKSGYRILVVNSKKTTDNTPKIVREKGVELITDHGLGKGDGLRTAIEHSNADVLVFIDGDGSHIPGDIPKIVKPILQDKADMVIASRMLGGSEELHGTTGQAFRLFASVIITLIINYRWNVRITDSQNGFRAIKTAVARNLGLEANVFDIETELCAKCAKKGYRITEVPSCEHKRKKGRSNLNPLTMGHLYAWRLFKNLI